MRKTVDLIVPVFRAQGHISEFLESIFAWDKTLNFDLMIHLYIDGADNHSVEAIEQTVKSFPSASVNIVCLEQRIGQQAVILQALRQVALRKNIVVISDDDILLDSKIFEQIVGPVIRGFFEMVVVQQRAQGLRALTSTLFWASYRLLANKRIRGRDLMLRCISAELAARLANAPTAGFSVAIELDSLTQKASRVNISQLTTLSRKSRYSSFERFRLFAELVIISRKELGLTLIWSSLVGIVLIPIAWLALSLLGLIEPFSQGSILALLVGFLGLFNLGAIGANQVSLAMVVRER